MELSENNFCSMNTSDHYSINELRDESLFTFVKFYLSKRYEGLISDESSSFASTEEFAEKMLKHLFETGLNSTRQEFFNDQMMPHFQRIYDRVKHRNFDYDGKVFLPFIQKLPPNASVLDFGAGNNNFLPAMANRLGREDIEYYATDYFVNEGKSLDKGSVKFIHQPSANELPKDRYFDFIFLRRVAHHILDFELIIKEIKSRFRPNGLLVLIEDSYDDKDSSIYPEMESLVDKELTEKFYQDLTPKQKIKLLQFNDFYSNYLYHNWTSMPLPMNHKTFSEWDDELKNLGMEPFAKYNMGFPRNIYNLHQAATGILCYKV
jgi:SAM-dependent methyltransferase